MSLSSAAGVVAEYWGSVTDHPLEIMPGETKEVTFTLQNMVGDQALAFKATITDGASWAKLSEPDKIYNVPAKSDDVKVVLKVTAPTDVSLDQSQRIGISFAQVASSDNGKFQFGSAFDKYFYAIIPTPQKSPAKSDNSWIMTMIVVLAAIIVIWVIVKRKKSSM